MFEHLDDPVPPSPAALDRVAARGRRLRVRRRAIAGTAVIAVLAGTFATAAALQSDGARKVIVENNSTSSTTPASTVPGSTSTTTPTASTVATSTTTPRAPGFGPITSVTTVPHDPHDLSMVTVAYPRYQNGNGCGPPQTPCHLITFSAGTGATFSYDVTNSGDWAVNLGPCTGEVIDIWTHPATSAWGPYSAGIWPEPYPARGADAEPQRCDGPDVSLPAHDSITLTAQILGGYRNAAGDVMPAPPGFTSIRAPFQAPCIQPCDQFLDNSLGITVNPPNLPDPFTIDVKTMHPTAAPGAAVPVELTYTNDLAFSVRMPLFGPCWKVKTGTGTVDCSRALAAVIVGPHATVDLVGTVYARKGFEATGAPLAPGDYAFALGNLSGLTDVLTPTFPVLTVS